MVLTAVNLAEFLYMLPMVFFYSTGGLITTVILKSRLLKKKVKDLVVDDKMEVEGCNFEAPWYLPVSASCPFIR